MKSHRELRHTKEFYVYTAQADLLDLLYEYMDKNNLNRTQLANKLGVSKGYITQLMSGRYDHKFSKISEMALAIGKAPIVTYKDLEQYILEDEIEARNKAYEALRSSAKENAGTVRPLKAGDEMEFFISVDKTNSSTIPLGGKAKGGSTFSMREDITYSIK